MTSKLRRLARLQSGTKLNLPETIDAIFSSVPLRLDSNEIRLVTLEPARNMEARPVCTLQVAPLTKELSYEALSWAWGDPARRAKIELAGQCWFTVENLVQALRHIRLEDKPRILWIDALCINQHTDHAALQERSQQVQKMKYIYSMASATLVWLGMPTTESRMLFRTGSNNSRPWEAKFSNKKSVNVLSHEWVFSRKEAAVVSAVTQLLERDWWLRMWCIQEVVLSPNVFCYLGSNRFGFEFLLNMMESFERFLRSNDFDIKVFEGLDDGADSISSLNDTLQRRRALFSTLEASTGKNILVNRNGGVESVHGPGRFAEDNMMLPDDLSHVFGNFRELLSRCRYHLASDPRDKIYGLLGLADEAVIREIKADYGRTMRDTFIRSAERIILFTRSLDLLSQALPQAKSTTSLLLPSWVPDWTLTSLEWYKTVVPRSTGKKPADYFNVSAAGSDARVLFQASREEGAAA